MTEPAITPRRYLHLRGAADTASIRIASFMGREHVVVPVVALIGGAVVRPMGSKGPEYVPAEELSLVPGAWNGRPVVPDHPVSPDGAPISAAHTPETLEAHQFGLVHNTRYEGGRLKMDAYIDPTRADALGGDALSALTRAQAGQDVEVSVGAWVYADQESGVSPSGVAYEYVWREIVPDHLAMLPEGVTGACSVEMGCGAPRAARKDTMPKTKKKARELRAAKVRFSASITNREMRDWLESELAQVEPSAKWLYVQDIDQDVGFVIYEMATETEPEVTYRRTFSVEGDAMTLSSDREEVRTKITYVPASAVEVDVSEIVYNTTDGGQSLSVDESMTTATTCSCPRKDPPMADNTAAVDRLIASSASPFTEETREQLGKFDAATLKSLESRYLAEAEEPEEEAESPPVAAAPAASPEPAADVVQLSRERYEAICAMADAHEAEQKRRKDALVASLKAAQSVYSEPELQALDLESLRKVSKLCKVDEPAAVDFSGRGLVRPASPEDDMYMNPPDPYALAIAKRNEASGGTN